MEAATAHDPWRWHPHPEVWLLVVVVIGLGLYVSRVIAPKMVAAGYPPINRRQKGFFWAGVALLWLASDWPIHDIGEQYLFSVHMTQHLLLSFVLPPLFLFATPGWLVQLVIGRGRVGRFLLTGARPLVAGLAFNLFVALTHWSAVVNLAVTSGPVHYLLHVALVVLAVLMWMPVCSPLPELRLPPLLQCAYLFLMTVIPTVPAAWLTFAEGAVYAEYDKPYRLWGVSVASDQQTAGLIMKIAGAGLLWAIIIVIFFRWAAVNQADEQRRARASVVRVAGPESPGGGSPSDGSPSDEVLTWQAVSSELERLGPARPSPRPPPDRPPAERPGAAGGSGIAGGTAGGGRVTSTPMIDLRRLRADPDGVRAQLARRHIDLAPLERVLALDADQRKVAQRRDELRARRNELSQEVGRRMREGDRAGADQRSAESRALADDERELTAEADRLAAELRAELLVLPNLPAALCPDGRDERDNVVVRVVGHDPDGYSPHQRVPHWDVGAELGILDLERGAKLSGSMFVVYRAGGAALVRALIQFGLDRNSDTFEEIRPPTLVTTETMVSTGHLPKFVDDAYHLERDDLWAIPTAEVPLTSLGRDEILDEATLPQRFMAHTSCFRREAGSAGRDTRGLLRVHEFDKVEILAYATQEQAAEVHADLLARCERTITELGLAYRVLDLCTGDLGNSSARTFDLEVYAPGVDRWLEVSSVSWFSDYQARRANIRYRPAGQKGTEVVHTLNGSALAVPRVWAALVETYRRADGQVAVPEVLRPYLGGRDVVSPGPSR